MNDSIAAAVSCVVAFGATNLDDLFLIAVVTGANGSGSLAISTPLFAAGGVRQTVIIIAVLLPMVWVWCFIADWLAGI